MIAMIRENGYLSIIIDGKANVFLTGLNEGTGTHIATGWLDVGIKEDGIAIRFVS